MAGCGGCANRGKMINRALDRANKGNISPAKAAGYVIKSGFRDLSKLAKSSLNKTKRR